MSISIENWKIERFTKIQSVVTKDVKEQQKTFNEKIKSSRDHQPDPPKLKPLPSKKAKEPKKPPTLLGKIEKKEEPVEEFQEKGTRLLDNAERLETLKNLKLVKDGLESQLEKLPISLKTVAVLQKKQDIERKLDEVNKAIESFSKPKVYITVE